MLVREMNAHSKCTRPIFQKRRLLSHWRRNVDPLHSKVRGGIETREKATTAIGWAWESFQLTEIFRETRNRSNVR